MAPADASITLPERRRSLRYRAGVAGRVLLAALGGYGVAALSTALLSLVLPLPRSEAVAAATLASFAVMVAVVVAVFAARTLTLATLRIGAVALALGGAFLIARSVLGGAA